MSLSEPFAGILPVPEEIFREPMYVTAAGWEHLKPGEATRVVNPTVYEMEWRTGRVLPEFCLAWLDAGSGVMETGRGVREVRAGGAFLYQPGEWHRHRPLDAMGWTIYWIHFNGDLPHRWMDEGLLKLDGNLLRIDEPELFRRQLERLLRTVERAPMKNSTALGWQATGLLSHLLNDAPTRGGTERHSDDELVNRAVGFIWSHSHASVGVPEVAAYAGCGRRVLERRFASVLGSGILAEIHRCRMERARRLLAETNLPVKQVVSRAGLTSYKQLYLMCREHLGLPPIEYREREHAAKSAAAANASSYLPNPMP